MPREISKAETVHPERGPIRSRTLTVNARRNFRAPKRSAQLRAWVSATYQDPEREAPRNKDPGSCKHIKC